MFCAGCTSYTYPQGKWIDSSCSVRRLSQCKSSSSRYKLYKLCVNYLFYIDLDVCFTMCLGVSELCVYTIPICTGFVQLVLPTRLLARSCVNQCRRLKYTTVGRICSSGRCACATYYYTLKGCIRDKVICTHRGHRANIHSTVARYFVPGSWVIQHRSPASWMFSHQQQGVDFCCRPLDKYSFPLRTTHHLVQKQ